MVSHVYLGRGVCEVRMLNLTHRPAITSCLSVCLSGTMSLQSGMTPSLISSLLTEANREGTNCT